MTAVTRSDTPKATSRARARKSEQGNGQGKGRQAEVLDVAARIFHEKGYEATSIQDIADALGMLKGSVYYYINSKEDLLYSLVEQVHRSELERLHEVLAEGGDPVRQLRDLVETHVLANLENHVISAVFHHDFRSLSEPRRSAIIEERDKVEHGMRDIIRRGQDLGVFRTDADAKVITLGILGMANSFYTWYVESGDNSPAEIATQFADFSVRGLLADGVAMGERSATKRSSRRPRKVAPGARSRPA